jgi:hypothetical protein
MKTLTAVLPIELYTNFKSVCKMLQMEENSFIQISLNNYYAATAAEWLISDEEDDVEDDEDKDWKNYRLENARLYFQADRRRTIELLIENKELGQVISFELSDQQNLELDNFLKKHDDDDISYILKIALQNNIRIIEHDYDISNNLESTSENNIEVFETHDLNPSLLSISSPDLPLNYRIISIADESFLFNNAVILQTLRCGKMQSFSQCSTNDEHSSNIIILPSRDSNS